MKTMLRSIFLFLSLSCLAMAQHSATVSWSWAQGTGDAAVGYHVQRSATTGGPYTVIATVSPATVLSYVDNAVVGGQTYFYVVTAFNSAGDSPLSNEAKAIIPITMPVAPTGLTATVK